MTKLKKLIEYKYQNALLKCFEKKKYDSRVRILEHLSGRDMHSCWKKTHTMYITQKAENHFIRDNAQSYHQLYQQKIMQRLRTSILKKD